MTPTGAAVLTAGLASVTAAVLLLGASLWVLAKARDVCDVFGGEDT